MATPLRLARAEPARVPIAEIAPNAAAIARQQIEAARAALSGDPEESLVFPFREVHRLVGRVRPGRLVFVYANTGHGKTTFLLNTTRQLLRANIPMPARIDYLGTEQKPEELWTKMACLDLGISPDIPINLAWDEAPPGTADRVDDALLFLQTAYGIPGRLRMIPDKFITLARVEEAARDAADAGQTVLIVDHVDRIETQGQNEFVAMRDLIRRLKELARDYDLVMLVATQSNRKGREGDRLAVYHAPRLENMRGGGTKEEEADVVLGLHRPVRCCPPNVSVEEWGKTIKMVKQGTLETSAVISLDRMVITVLKHRTRSNEGAQCFLHVERGVLSDEAVRDGMI